MNHDLNAAMSEERDRFNESKANVGTQLEKMSRKVNELESMSSQKSLGVENNFWINEL